jgi:phage terminase large subunit-like protein
VSGLETLAVNDATALLLLARDRILHDQTAPPRRPLFDHQVPPPQPWDVWLLIAGRGAGKTEAGARYVDEHAKGPACIEGPVPHRMAIVSPSHDDAVDTCVRGETGLLQVNRGIRFRPGALLQADLTWPNGSEAELFGTFAPEDVERFRGPQHCLVWGDEFAAWRKLDESWQMIEFGLRLGPHPHTILTTTPKRRPLLKTLMTADGTVITRAKTSDNPGLPEARREALYRRYGGTTIGRQELDAEILEDVAGSLWRRTLIETLRVTVQPELKRIVVAIDPSATSTESADECGITVAGVDAQGHGYVLADLSLRTDPASWARVAVDAYHRYGADRVVAETNQGGDMVEHVLRTIDSTVAYKGVTATRGKLTRAEPIAALYEQGRVHHVGTYELLEDQMCQWVPGEKSPDRMDSLVWAMTELMIAPLDDNPWAALAGQRAGGVA